MKIFDPEPLMDRAVRAVGGCRVRELVGVNPPFDNADYLFDNDNVVAELKSLETDFLGDPSVRDKMDAYYNRWIDEGKDAPIIYGGGVLRTDEVPIECAREFMDIFKDKLESGVLRKANRQIRETKKHLVYPDALGLLLLSNEGNFVFDPAMLSHVLLHSLGSKFSSVDHVIFFSANLAFHSPQAAAGAPFASIRFPNRRHLDDGFLNRLGTHWFEVLGAATGRVFPPFSIKKASRSEIDQIRFRALL